MYKYLFALFTTFAFSQNSETHKRKLYLEVCSSSEISICGNYFEQDIMREPLLIELNKRSFLESYDTVFSFSHELSWEVDNHIKKYSTDDTLSIIYPDKFLLKLNKFLKKERFKEKGTKTFKYIPLNVSFSIEKTESSKICIINPDFYNIKRDNLFLIKDVIIVQIKNISIDNSSTYTKEVIYLDKKGSPVEKL